MLVLLNFDSASVPLLEELLDEGRLPVLRDLLRRGTRYTLETPAAHFPAGTYPSLYYGTKVADHGLYYPFQWSHREQRVRHAEHFPAPPGVWERVSSDGARVLLIDPYEARMPERLNGVGISGWQFRNRVVLPSWSHPRAAHRQFTRRFGRAPSIEEVFGSRSLATLRGMRRDLLGAPGRVAALARHVLAKETVDLMWLTFSATHLAGHQFWDLSQLSDAEREKGRREGLDHTLADVYAAADAAIGQSLETLPDDADIVLFSGLGMGPNTSRADLLPSMLTTVLSRRRAAASASERSGSRIWGLRAAVPTGLRASVANALPRRAVLDLTARLEARGSDWSQIRAFTLPSDGVGYIRLNLQGRERDGIVPTTEAHELGEEIVQGLMSFADADGRPSIASVDRVDELEPGAARDDMLPDLVVRWGEHPSAQVDRVISAQFGEIRRLGSGSGRSGNHTDDAWALVLPGRSRLREGEQTHSVVDIAATVCAVLGTDAAGLAGKPLLEP